MRRSTTRWTARAALAALPVPLLVVAPTAVPGASGVDQPLQRRAATALRTMPSSELGVDSPRGLAVRNGLLVVSGRKAGKDVTVRVTSDGDERGPAQAGTAARAMRSGGDVAAVNPRDGLTYAADTDSGLLVARDKTGRTVRTYSLDGLDTDRISAMVFAPSADSTDPATTQSLYVADPGTATTKGSITEVSLAPQPQTAATTSATVVRTTDTSLWLPSSPDPSGVGFIGDNLVIGDGEVEEMPIYAGVNLFEASRDGTLQKRGTSLPWSIEPVGIGWDPNGKRLLVSDDDKDRVFFVSAGADGTFGTSDDGTVTSLPADAHGSGDAEGVDFDSKRNRVLISDGVDREVFIIAAGADGTFGTADDTSTRFDTAIIGAQDPEGMGYDAVRDTLLVLDDGSDMIYELTQTGSVINAIDIRGANINKAAGIAVAPGSTDPTKRTYYVVARGVDNNSDPTENDGRLFELSANLPTITNLPPTADAGLDQEIELPAGATLTGTVTDEDNKPGPLTGSWSQVSGPGPVTFGTPTAPTTTVTFPAAGSYVLRLTANDGQLTDIDDVVVTVVAAGGQHTLVRTVVTGTDDAEQSVTNGAMQLGSARLELVEEATTGVQQVGIRFQNLSIPRNAHIDSAYIQFRNDGSDSGLTSLTIKAEAADNSGTFTKTSRDISNRPVTTAAVPWSPPAWTTALESGSNQRTPSLVPLIKEVTARPGWAAGNAMAFVITGSGRRTASAFERTNGIPVLTVVWRTNLPPVVSAGPDQLVNFPAAATLAGTVTDTEQPPARTDTWSLVSGPAGGSVAFADASSAATTATFSQPGAYVLRLTSSDGLHTAFDEVAVQVNAVPVVSAGADKTIELPDKVSLDGSASDPDAGPTALTLAWSKVSGKGTVKFANAAAATTTASFSEPDTYVLRLTANDGAGTWADDVTVTALPTGAVVHTTRIRLAGRTDDAEQRASNGMTYTTSTDLDIVKDGSVSMSAVGLRFRGLDIPRGSKITAAWVEFKAAASTGAVSSLTVQAHKTGNAPTFRYAQYNITSRPLTLWRATWKPIGWNKGKVYRTANVAAPVQAIVNRGDWFKGNSLALVIRGSSNRVAYAYDGGTAPVLHIKWYRR